MRFLNYLMSLMREANHAKNAKDIPELTEYLKGNQQFQKASWSVHHMKKKMIHRLDKEAFGEEQQKS